MKTLIIIAAVLGLTSCDLLRSVGGFGVSYTHGNGVAVETHYSPKRGITLEVDYSGK